MRSKLAEQLRKDTDEMARQMSPADRMALALRLGERALRNFAHARGLTHAEARRVLQRESQRGRRYSRCMEELDREPPR